MENSNYLTYVVNSIINCLEILKYDMDKLRERKECQIFQRLMRNFSILVENDLIKTFDYYFNQMIKINGFIEDHSDNNNENSVSINLNEYSSTKDYLIKYLKEFNALDISDFLEKITRKLISNETYKKKKLHTLETLLIFQYFEYLNSIEIMKNEKK
jgi:hypothetical protein